MINDYKLNRTERIKELIINMDNIDELVDKILQISIFNNMGSNVNVYIGYNVHKDKLDIISPLDFNYGSLYASVMIKPLNLKDNLNEYKLRTKYIIIANYNADTALNAINRANSIIMRNDDFLDYRHYLKTGLLSTNDINFDVIIKHLKNSKTQFSFDYNTLSLTDFKSIYEIHYNTNIYNFEYLKVNSSYDDDVSFLINKDCDYDGLILEVINYNVILLTDISYKPLVDSLTETCNLDIVNLVSLLKKEDKLTSNEIFSYNRLLQSNKLMLNLYKLIKYK